MSPFSHPSRRRASQRKWAMSRRAEMRDLLNVFRDFIGICQRCHRTLESLKQAEKRLDFHHIDPATKSFELTDAVNKRFNWWAIGLEILKCALVCEDCHREIHKELRAWQ